MPSCGVFLFGVALCKALRLGFLMTGAAHILVIEDDPILLRLYTEALAAMGYNVAGAATAGTALTRAAEKNPDLIVFKLDLPDMGGLDLMEALRLRGIAAPLVVITDKSGISAAVEALRCGASDFLVKPFYAHRLVEAINAELEKKNSHSVPAPLAGAPAAARLAAPAQPEDFGGFIGSSPVMAALYEKIRRATGSNAAVFITGESGTGKEVCAEAIHRHGPRAARPFIPINCAAIPRELLESELFGHVKGAFTGAIAEREGAVRLADGGTLFLDEIAEMHNDMQSKLLRFLQDFTFMKVGGSRLEKTDIRIVCATNKDPAAEVRAGRFREDLFYRLHVLRIHMPPLRERGGDVVEIARLFLRRYAAEEKKSFTGFTEEAEDILRACPWPGNIRQLQNVIRQIVVMNDAKMVSGRLLSPVLLHDAAVLRGKKRKISSPGEDVIRPLAEVEREAIERAIRLSGGNIPLAAAKLGVAASTIYRKKAGWEG